jgi:hypothetical protein
MDHILLDQGDVKQGEKRTEEKLKAESGNQLTTEITWITDEKFDKCISELRIFLCSLCPLWFMASALGESF